MRAITVAGLTKAFAGPPVTHALRGVDLVVPAGSLTAVLGPSGCGKTTLLRIIAGFDRADGGTVHLDDRLIEGEGRSEPPERRNITVVPQEGALFPHLDVAGNVAFGLRGTPRQGRRQRVAAVLELVGLAGFQGRYPSELSGGQQQRVAVARALAPDPAVVLLDEPFAALDAGLRSDVREQVAAALRTTGRTAILVTHDPVEALSLADQVAVMHDGRVAQAGPPGDLYHHPADIDTARILGPTVVLPGAVAQGSASCALGTLPTRTAVPDGACEVFLRPEQITVLAPDLAAPPRPGERPPTSATVLDASFRGHETALRVRLDADGTEITCRVAGHTSPEVGATVHLHTSGSAVTFPPADAGRVGRPRPLSGAGG